MRKAAFIVIGLLLFLLIGGTALAMTSDSYKLPWSSFSSGGGERSSTNYILNDSIGALSAGGAESDNYKLRSVLQYRVSGMEVLPGDANEDNVINIFDMTKVARIILQMDSPTPGADANEDNVINIFDMTKIARIILELD